MKETERRVGLRQVAQRAGVSLSTASNVFADKPGVAISEETRNAVLAAAAELKYRPRPRQEIVQFSKITSLGLILAKPLPLLTHPFYSYLIHGVQEACEARNISLMYSRVEPDAASFDELPAMVQNRQVQGLLVIGYFQDEFYILLRRREQPFVMVDHYVEQLRPDSIVCEDQHGAFLATQYLIEHGHRTPVLLSGPLEQFTARERLEGYRQALTAYNLPYDERNVRECEDWSVNAGYSEMLHLLDQGERPTAVFCANDELAIGALNALSTRGLCVPDDCSLIGFNDIQLARYTTPPLTTVKVEKEWMGAQAMWQLVERIAHPDLPPRRTFLGVSLLERQSVKAIEGTA